MRSLINRAGGLVDSLAARRAMPAGITGNLLAPMYHTVSDVPVPHIDALYSIKSVAEFEADLDCLLRDFQPVDLHQVLAIADGVPPPEGAFFLSFDDGLREIAEVIAPILHRKGVPATFFLTTDFLGNADLFYRFKACLLAGAFGRSGDPRILRRADEILDARGIPAGPAEQRVFGVTHSQHEVLDELAPVAGVDFAAYLSTVRPFMEWDEVQKLLDLGFTVGAHSIDHPRFALLDLDEQLRQARGSMDVLATRFGLEYRTFAFPFDDRDVPDRFFDEIFGDGSIEMTFGTSAYRVPDQGRRLQRLWMEDEPKDARRRIVGSYLRGRLRRLASGLLRAPAVVGLPALEFAQFGTGLGV